MINRNVAVPEILPSVDFGVAVHAHVIHGLTPERLSILTGRHVGDCVRAMLTEAYHLGIQRKIGGEWSI